MCGGRPMLVATNVANPAIPQGTITLIGFSQTTLNNWNLNLINASFSLTGYTIPFAGWYLLTGSALISCNFSGQQGKFAFGFTVTQNTSPINTDGGAVPGSAQLGVTGANGAELAQLNSGSADSVAFYAFQNAIGNPNLSTCAMNAEWVALPSGNVFLPAGTVVASPAAAAAFPSGPGTYLTNSITAGAGTITVADTTGMITGGTLGLDWHMGQPEQPAAEAVTITGVPGGGTVTVSATSYPHAQNAKVAVPVSYKFMNQQVRDAINFLSYPPILRASAGTVQAIASSGVGTPVQITSLSVSGTAFAGDIAHVDNFSGFASSSYVAPVSGLYFVYGQAYLAGSTTAFAAGCGVAVNSGTITWGTQFLAQTTSSPQSVCPNVTTELRLTAGSTVSLWAYQGSGASMNTIATANVRSKLIAVWRNF